MSVAVNDISVTPAAAKSEEHDVAGHVDHENVAKREETDRVDRAGDDREEQ